MDELIEKVYKAVNVMSGEIKTAWDYGVGFPLYHSEVHLLEAINLHRGANAGELARRLGISNAAVSQVAKKLVKKALAETYRAEDNQKEVFFRLTDLGKKACAGHKKHHTKMYAGFIDDYKTFTKKDLEAISKFLDSMIESMPVKHDIQTG
ncbi:MarR family transcriptional regulator [Treponema primitia]|uniref:MarR family transcriptional regulator n=1 Tax=Treponema primitia TaxID=88058 RepID=UPI0039813AF5